MNPGTAPATDANQAQILLELKAIRLQMAHYQREVTELKTALADVKAEGKTNTAFRVGVEGGYTWVARAGLVFLMICGTAAAIISAIFAGMRHK